MSGHKCKIIYLLGINGISAWGERGRQAFWEWWYYVLWSGDGMEGDGIRGGSSVVADVCTCAPRLPGNLLPMPKSMTLWAFSPINPAFAWNRRGKHSVFHTLHLIDLEKSFTQIELKNIHQIMYDQISSSTLGVNRARARLLHRCDDRGETFSP